MKFDDGSHCHWTYRIGAYSTPFHWPTEADARHAAGVLEDNARMAQTPEVFQVHSPNHCACNDAKIEEPAA